MCLEIIIKFGLVYAKHFLTTEKRRTMDGIRINKFLSEAGVCSRREGDRLVSEGRVTLDGRIAVAGDKVMASQKVAVDGKEVVKVEE